MYQMIYHQMGNVRRWIILVLFIFAGTFGVAGNALAVVTCQERADAPPRELTPILSAAVSSAGNDQPVGQVIYLTSIAYSGYAGIKCDGPYSLDYFFTVSDSPSGAPVTMTTELGTGPVYPTNVPGIGAVVWTGIQGYTQFISNSQLYAGTLTKNSAGSNGISSTAIAALSLVKIGPISSGSVVNGISLPHISMRIPATSGYAGLPIRLMVASFGGSLQFSSQTCTTPDVNVDMGTYDISDNFTGLGTASKWVDSSIVLQNCPLFSGYYSGFNGGSGQYFVDSGITMGGSKAANLFSVSLTPVNSVTNSVISLDDVSDAARGVGIQLGYTPNYIDAIATSPQKIWTVGTSWDVTAPNDGTSNIKIPLAARYYQTDNSVTPGKANAKVIFNIYYK